MMVSITQLDIEMATKGTHFDPLHRALERLNPGAHITVGVLVANIGARSFRLGPSARTLIRAWDLGEPIRVQEVEIWAL